MLSVGLFTAMSVVPNKATKEKSWLYLTINGLHSIPVWKVCDGENSPSQCGRRAGVNSPAHPNVEGMMVWIGDRNWTYGAGTPEQQPECRCWRPGMPERVLVPGSLLSLISVRCEDVMKLREGTGCLVDWLDNSLSYTSPKFVPLLLKGLRTITSTTFTPRDRACTSAVEELWLVPSLKLHIIKYSFLQFTVCGLCISFFLFMRQEPESLQS